MDVRRRRCYVLLYRVIVKMHHLCQVMTGIWTFWASSGSELYHHTNTAVRQWCAARLSVMLTVWVAYIITLCITYIGELASIDLGIEQPIKTSASSTTPSEYEIVDDFHSLENIPSVKENVPRYLCCRVCTQEKRTRETHYRCKDCEDNPPLCPAPCFSVYHGH